jgi:putative DNA methylase
LSEFFLAWVEQAIGQVFPDWYTDSKRALAITGSDESFRKNMVDCYRNLAAHMPDHGLQVVMFTHQDASVWADLALILWASGLRVTAAWTIGTETESALKEGNYVQGTVLLVLRKQTGGETAFLDEIYPEVEHEVEAQLEAMLALEDQEDPNFGDTVYQLAAYAAALRVLTRYKTIEDLDVTYELSKPRKKGETSPIEQVIGNAVKVACDFLLPRGFDAFVWKTLTPDERFYLKGLDLESHGEHRAGAYQWVWG